MRHRHRSVFWLAGPACCFAFSLTGFAADDNAGALKVVYVVTDEQKLYAWDGNELVYEFDVVTGRPGKEPHDAFATLRPGRSLARVARPLKKNN